MKKLLLFLTITLTALPVLANEGQYLTYDTFIRQVEAGNIKSVTLGSFSSITGELAEGNTTNTFHSNAYLGAANDPLLTRFLEEHGVASSMSDISDYSTSVHYISAYITIWIPVALLLIFMILIIMKLNKILTNQQNLQQLIVAYSISDNDTPTGNAQT